MNRKKRKKTKGHEEARMDRLSNLPNCLIHHILSFMDTKSAVQTCILSKRWVHLWTHLPVIHIDSKCFTSLDNLKKFIAYVLRHRYPNNILGLSVHIHRGIRGDDLLDRIMNFVISHSVEMLDLSFGGSRNSWLLFQRIFKCQSLRVLKLSHFGNSGVPNSIGLASLKTLTLCDVTLYSQNYCFDLFSSCVNLENLVLDDVLVIFSTVFNIIAPRLVNLTMSAVQHFSATKPDECDFASMDKLKVVISAPRLTSFSFTCYIPVLLSMDNSPILEKVNLSMLHYDLPCTQAEDSFVLLIDMLRQLGNARSLTVSLGLVKFLSEHSRLLEEQPSPFSKLESLKVVRGRQSCKNIPPKVVNFLVQGSPMAEEIPAKFQKPEKKMCKQPTDDWPDV